MAPWKKVAAGAAVLLVILVGAVISRLAGLTKDLCGNVELARAMSPDGKLKAVTFQRDCGATTGFSTHVSLLAADEALENEGGNIFAADIVQVRLHWLSNTHLRIEYLEPARVFRKESRSKGVRIEHGSAARG